MLLFPSCNLVPRNSKLSVLDAIRYFFNSNLYFYDRSVVFLLFYFVEICVEATFLVVAVLFFTAAQLCITTSTSPYGTSAYELLNVPGVSVMSAFHTNILL
jgi:hypothetical protein